jgi:hypothetical protein
MIYHVNNNGQGITSNNFGTITRLIAGFRFFKEGTGGSIFNAVHQTGFGAFSISLALVADALGTYFQLDNGTLIGTGPVVPTSEWHHYEVDWTFSTTGAAVLNLYLDGNPTPFIHSTTNTSFAQAEAWALGGQGPVNHGQNGIQGNFADFYAFNGTGSAPFNAALAPQGLGAPKMAFAVPNGAGVISDWTANGAATIWQSINQIPQDGDTTYASDVTVGDQYQCVFSALPAMQTLISVQLSTYARTDDAGPRAYQSGFWKGGTFGYSGVNQFLGGSYNYIEDEFMVNPITGTAWTVADLTGLQFGAKLTV